MEGWNWGGNHEYRDQASTPAADVFAGAGSVGGPAAAGRDAAGVCGAAGGEAAGGDLRPQRGRDADVDADGGRGGVRVSADPGAARSAPGAEAGTERAGGPAGGAALGGRARGPRAG